MGEVILGYKNSPSIRQLIEELLREKTEGLSFKDIYDYVRPKVKLVGKTPRKSIYSVVTKMSNIQRDSSNKYTLTTK